MGASACYEIKNEKKGEIEVKQNDNIENFPFSIFLLSLIKIKEINSLILIHKEIIEKNPNLKLLQILNDLNKSTKLINDYANEFVKLFSRELLNIEGIEFYDFALKQICKELKIIDYKFNESLILNLFYFSANILCQNCKNKTENFHCLLLHIYIFDTIPFSSKIYCSYCNSKTLHLISTNNYPKIIISINKNLYRDDRKSEEVITLDYNLFGYFDEQTICYKSYENTYIYNIDNNDYQKIPNEEFECVKKKKIKKIGYIYRHNDLDKDSKDETLIKSFFANKNIKKVIINYYILKTENVIEEKMYLINKEYFDYLLLMNNVLLYKDDNNLGELDKAIERNQNEIMNMNKLIIYDEPSKILGDVDFVNEEVLYQLGINKNEYLGKEVKINQISKECYQILFKDNSMIRLVIKNNKQELIFYGQCSKEQIYINKTNFQNNLMTLKNNNSQYINKNKYSNNNINDIKNKTNIEENKIIQVENKTDKEIKEIKDKLLLYFSELKKLFNDISEVKNKINQDIKNENLEEYLIMDKKYFNQFTKILESNEIFENDNIIFNDLNNITKIQSLNDLEKLKSLQDIIEKRKNILKSENPFKLEYEQIIIDKEKISYPKDFVIIKENTLINILSKLDIKYKQNKSSFYKTLIGENKIFLQDNKRKNIFIYSSSNIIYNAEIVIKFNKEEQFLFEIKTHIIIDGFNMYLKKRKVDMSQRVQKLINLETQEIGKLAIVIKSNPFVKAIFYSLSDIPTLKISLQKLYANQNYLSFWLYNFIQIDKQNLIELNKNILSAEEILNKLSNQKLKSPDFKKLIKFILSTLDNELNIKQSNKTIKIEDYDQSFANKKFNEVIESKKNSIIFQLFCGIKKIFFNYQDCKTTKYKLKLFYFLFFKIDKSSPKDINTMIESYEKESKTLQGQCDYCMKKDESYIKNKEINKLPKILIIIFENKNNIKIDCSLSLKIKNENFNLISCVSKLDEKSEDFFILSKDENKYFIYDGNEKKEYIQDSKNSITNPYVLFYEKVETINEQKEIYLSDDNPPTFINEQKQMEEKESMINNNSINPMNNNINNNLNNIKPSINRNQINQNGSIPNINNNNAINNMINPNNSNNNYKNPINKVVFQNSISQQNNMNNMMNMNQQNNMNNINQQNNKINNQNNINQQNNNINNQNNIYLQNNMMNMNQQNNMINMNQQNAINKSWNSTNNMNNMNNNMNQQNNRNNMNFNNNMQINVPQQMNRMRMIQSMVPTNNFNYNQNNNQLMNNNNMQNFNPIMNKGNNQFMNQNMLINNNMNNQLNNNMMNPNAQNFQNGFNIINNNNQMNNMNNNMNNMQQFNNGMQMNNPQNVFMNQNNQNFNQMMNNNNQFNNQNNMSNNNNQFFNPNNNQFNNQNNFQMPNNNQFFNQNNNQMMNNNNQFLNQNNNQMMNNNNQMMNNNNQTMNNNNQMMNNNNQMMNNNNQMMNNNNLMMNNSPIIGNNNQMMGNNNQMMNNNNQFFNGNIIPQIPNNAQNMNQMKNNMPSIQQISNQIIQSNQNINIHNSVNPNIENNNNNGPSTNDDEITIYFNFRNDKQIYLDVNKNIKFNEVINQLKEKYEWLKPIKILGYVINGRSIEMNKSCAENGIEDSSKILIIEE